MPLSDVWYSNTSPPVLDIKRVCDEIGSSVFVASMWVCDPESAMQDQIMRLNTVKIQIDVFIEAMGGCIGKAPPVVLRLWDAVSKDKKFADPGLVMKEYVYLGRVMYLSNPMRLRDALDTCSGNPCMQVWVCRLFSDELDTAVELLSRQIYLIKRQVFESLA